MPDRDRFWKQRLAALGLDHYRLGDADPVDTRPARLGPPSAGRRAARIFADLAHKTRYVDPALAGHWPTIVGPEIAGLCRPGRLSGGRIGRTLEVHCRSAAAAARVQFEAETIRRKANGFLGPGAVGRVLVRQAESPAAPADDRLAAALGRFRRNISPDVDGN